METDRGFTILEVVITLLVTSLVISMTFSLAETQEKRRILAKVEEIRAAIEEAILLSAGSRGTISLLPGGNLQITSPYSSRSISGSDKLSFRLRPSGSPIRMYPSGAVTPASIIVQTPHHLCRLIVSLRGRVRRVC